MQADVILKEPPPWVPPFSLSGGARVEGGGGAWPPSYAPVYKVLKAPYMRPYFGLLAFKSCGAYLEKRFPKTLLIINFLKMNALFNPITIVISSK